MDFLLQGVLQQHEERIATMLETHKQQVVDMLVQHLSGFTVGSAMAEEPSHKRRMPPRYRSQLSDSAEPTSLASQNIKGSTCSTSRQTRVVAHETVSEVSETLRRGESDVIERLEFQRQRCDCCADSECYNSFRRGVAVVYQSRWFEWSISFAILLNAVLIGVSAELSMTDVNDAFPLWYRIGNVLFLAVFVTELAIRCVTEGCYFLNFANKNCGWNLFDLLLVASTLTEEVLESLRVTALNVSFMRLARVLRLIRVTRVLRVLKQLKELRIMVHGMLNCGKPLLWASLILGLLSYIYVVFCLQISSEWLRTLPERYEVGDPNYPQAAVDFVRSNFGSLRYGMYTLMKCTMGGVSWEDVADPLLEISPVLLAGFLLYVLFALACLLNLITAVFLDAAYERSHSEESQLLEHIEQKRAWINDAKLFFHNEFELHFGGSSTQMVKDEVDLEEFTEVVQAPRVRAWFEEHGLDIYFEDPKSLFELIDMDSDHKLDVHEFVVGLYRMKGGATSLNLQLEIQQVLGEIKLVKKLVTSAFLLNWDLDGAAQLNSQAYASMDSRRTLPERATN